MLINLINKSLTFTKGERFIFYVVGNIALTGKFILELKALSACTKEPLLLRTAKVNL